MGGLRTVTVLEHEVIPIVEGGEAPGMLADAFPWLSEAEAQALLRLNDLRRGFCQRLSGGIKLAQHCGIVRLPACVVEVLPKVGMADARTPDELERSRGALLAMLRSARQVAITKISPVPQRAVHAPLLDIFIEAFLQCALDQARRGLLSRYVAHADDLPVVKGRFQANGHVRRNLARPHLLHCEYDEFTADNAYNRAVRATLEACRPWASRASTQRMWFETHARYASISAVKMSAADVLRLPRDRTTHRYGPLLTWCEWLLAMTSPALSAGASQAPGLLFDMNKLFEAHVGARSPHRRAEPSQRTGPRKSDVDATGHRYHGTGGGNPEPTLSKSAGNLPARMSRSKRHTPIFGHTTATSEADDKRLWHKRWRAEQRATFAGAGLKADAMPVDRQAVSSTWTMAKDGKAWMSPQRQREIAGASAVRRGRSLPEQTALQARMLAKLRSK